VEESLGRLRGLRPDEVRPMISWEYWLCVEREKAPTALDDLSISSPLSAVAIASVIFGRPECHENGSGCLGRAERWPDEALASHGDPVLLGRPGCHRYATLAHFPVVEGQGSFRQLDDQRPMRLEEHVWHRWTSSDSPGPLAVSKALSAVFPRQQCPHTRRRDSNQPSLNSPQCRSL